MTPDTAALVRQMLDTLRHIESAVMDIQCQRPWIRDAARAAIAAADAALSNQPAQQSGEALTVEDVYFLTGVAFGPYLDKLTELPVGLLEVAGKISAAINDTAMVHRCREMSERLQSDRANHVPDAGKMAATVRWYCINNIGMATLCADQQDAQQTAADGDALWPQHAPHRAVQLVEANKA